MRKSAVLLMLLALLLALPASALAEAPVEAVAVEAAVELEEMDLMDPAVYAGEVPPPSGEAFDAVAAPEEAVVPDTAPLKLILGKGEKYTLQIEGAVGYKSSNAKIAAVSAKGVVTGKKAGASTTITVTRKKGSPQKIKVSVKKAPSKVTLNSASLKLEVGQTFSLTAKLPSGSASALKWSVGSKKVATVDDSGLVTAVGTGSTKVKVKTFNGNTAVCTVKVVPVNPANKTLRRFAEAAGVSNARLEKAAGATIEELNNWSADELTRVEFVTGNVRWKMSDNNWTSVTLVGYKGKPKVLNVKATYGNGLPVAGMNEGVFSGNSKLKKVVIAEGIEALPSYAFDTCVNLSDITLPDSLTNVGFHSFHRVGEKLAEPFFFTLPDNIVEQSFGECNSVMVCKKDSVTAHTLSDGGWDFTCPGEEDFRYHYAEYYREDSWEAEEDGVWGVQLALIRYVGKGGAVKIPKGVVYIRDGAFRDCDGITSVVIPEGVVRFCYDVFSGCTGIKRISFPSTLRSIQNKAFYGVTKVKYFDLPANLKGITGNGGGAHSFEGCTAVLRVKKGSDSAYLLSDRNYDVTFPGEEDFRYRYAQICGEGDWKAEEDGVWGVQLQLRSYVGKGGAVQIPKGAVYICPGAFQGCKKVTSVAIPKGVVRICSCAFDGCVNLTEVSFPATLKTIEDKAFRDVTKVEYFDLPANLKGITGNGGGAHTFEGCTAALRVKKGSKSAKLLSDRNYNVTFPGEEDFRYRYERHDENGKAVYRLHLWDYVGPGGEVVIPEGVYGVGRTPSPDPWHPAFYENESITGVVIPEGTVIVEDSAFSGCKMLTNITLPSTLRILKNHAFERTGTTAGKRFIVVLPVGLEEITAGTGAGWDSFNESGATIVSQNATISKALYEGWYVFYNTLEDAQNRVHLRFKPNDDPNFEYRGKA